MLVVFALIHLTVDAVAEQGLRLNCQVDAEQQANDSRCEQQTHHGVQCSGFSHGGGHRANDEGQEGCANAHEGHVHSGVATLGAGAVVLANNQARLQSAASSEEAEQCDGNVYDGNIGNNQYQSQG